MVEKKKSSVAAFIAQETLLSRDCLKGFLILAHFVACFWENCPSTLQKKKLPLMNMNDLFSKTLLYEATFSIKSSIQYYYSTHHNVLLMKSPEVCSRNPTSSNIIAQVLLYFNWQGGCVCSHIGETNNRVSAGLQKVFKKLDLVSLKKKTSFITKSCF